MLYLKTTGKDLAHLLVVPFIYLCAIPIVLLDICVEIYHRVCFPLCDLPYVDRSKYIKMDRHRLGYLDTVQKINCSYCGYANGVFRYWVQIAAVTEAYWCGIQHAKDSRFEPPAHHDNFVPYGNQKAFVEKYQVADSAPADPTPVSIEQTEDLT